MYIRQIFTFITRHIGCVILTPVGNSNSFDGLVDEYADKDAGGHRTEWNRFSINFACIDLYHEKLYITDIAFVHVIYYTVHVICKCYSFECRCRSVKSKHSVCHNSQ